MQENLVRFEWEDWQVFIRRHKEKDFARFGKRVVFFASKKDVYPHVTQKDFEKFTALRATDEPPNIAPEAPLESLTTMELARKAHYRLFEQTTSPALKGSGKERSKRNGNNRRRKEKR